MHIHQTTIPELTGDGLATWSAIQRDEPGLASPYFRPEFAQAVASVRDDVEVAILEEGGQAVGFFPYQRSAWNVGLPVGSRLSDYHGVVAAAGVKFEPRDLLRACGLRAWHFNHLPPEQSRFAPYIWRTADSFCIDPPPDFNEYFALRENGQRLKAECGQKRRKLEREVGPLRSLENVADPALIATLIEWKSAQYRRTKMPNILSYAWARELLEMLPTYRNDDFAPAISVVYAGNTIASVRFDLRSRSLLHGWFATYNVELARYSPGLLHWMETIRTARSSGIERIDLGKGREAYKRRLMTGSTKVAEGSVDLRESLTAVRRAWWTTRDQIGKSPLAESVRTPAQIVLRVKHWLEAR
jgi:CelD/BcsL family acetyltransferase involved in cellulose biosynthesis